MNMTDEMIRSAIAAIDSESFGDNLEIYRRLIGLIDLTTLEGNDTNEKVIRLCHQGFEIENAAKSIPHVAAICVYPTLVKTAKNALAGRDINVAAVAGAFPSGQSPLELRLAEVRYAVEQGADEIDMVISRGRLLSGDVDFVRREIEEHKTACGEAHLKVILETGELGDYDLIYRTSMLAMRTGADFIKTSTGKISPAATPEAAWVMVKAISDFYQESGKKIGFKPAGGIGDPASALVYYKIVASLAGEAWLNKSLFRIGASRLLGKLLAEIENS